LKSNLDSDIWLFDHEKVIFEWYFLLIPVKFLREVTPYFRKASIISEVGWELQRAFLCPTGASTSPAAAKTPPRADTRYIPLQLTHLARNLKYNDPGKVLSCWTEKKNNFLSLSLCVKFPCSNQLLIIQANWMIKSMVSLPGGLEKAINEKWKIEI
jgi:hypothetical protein